MVKNVLKINGVCLRPHGRSENFIMARFIILNTTVFYFGSIFIK